MKEIKFRAWDKELNEMFDVHALILKDNCLNVVDGMGSKPHVLDEHNDIHYLDDIVLMSFTDLKDKNGKDIYEGDIVKIFDNCITPVIYKNGAFGYIFDDGFISFESNHYFRWINGMSDKIEVIGNIYESPRIVIDDLTITKTVINNLFYEGLINANNIDIYAENILINALKIDLAILLKSSKN